MDTVSDWGTPVLNATSNILQAFLEYLPQLLVAAMILIVGWIVASLARALAVKIAQSVDRLSELLGIHGAISPTIISGPVVSVIGNIVFWLVILFFVTSATNKLGLTLFAGWMDSVISHLPNFLSGALIIVAGFIVGKLVGDAVTTAAQNFDVKQRNLLGRAAQAFSVATMLVIGFDQIGIDITVLITIFSLTVGALLGGLAIAFSLGSKTLVSNLIGAHYLNKEYRIGESISVGGVSGTIQEINSVAVIIETEDGRMNIPAKIFSEETTYLVRGENAHAK